MGLVGSTAARVMVSCPTAVVIARHQAPSRRAVVVAADLKKESDGVMAQGVAVAKWRDCDVHVVHACTEEDQSDETVLRQSRIELEMQLARALAGKPPPPGLKTHVAFGAPGAVIWNYVARVHADLVVMGMMGRTGADRILRANTAEQVLVDLPCSLMTVRF